MIALMKKDLYTQRKTAFIAPIFLILFFMEMGKELGNVATVRNLIFSLAIAFISYVMVIYSNFNTEAGDSRQNQLLLSLPVGRRTVINTKYSMVAVWWLVSYLSCTIIAWLTKFIDPAIYQSPLDERMFVMSLCLTYILSSICYPLYYKFGWKAAQFTGLLLFFGFSFGMGKLIKVENRTNIFSILIHYPLLACLTIAIVLSVVSYFLSLRFFQAKEF